MRRRLRRPHLAEVVAFALVVLVPFSTAWGAVTTGPVTRRVLFLDDDAWYYFGVARSLGRGDGSTFNGLVETNGYQPLWQAMLVPIHALIDAPWDFVAAVMVLQALLWGVAVLVLVATGHRLGRPLTGWLAVGATFPVAITGPRLAFNGMESGLAIALDAVVLALAVDRVAPGERRAPSWALAAALALLCLTRIDAAPAVGLVAIAVAAMAGGPISDVVRRTIGLVWPAAVTLVAYALLNVLAFGVPVPVSGLVKTIGPPSATSVLDVGAQIGLPVAPLGRLVAVAAIAAFAVVLASPDRRRALQTPTGRVTVVVLAMFTGFLVHISALVWTLAYPTWPWYFHAVPVMAAGFVLAAATVLPPGSGRAAGVVATALALVALYPMIRNDWEPPPIGFQEANVDVANRLRDELPADAVVAMGDRAGSFGYFYDRPLLQLEGLMADKAWYDALREGEVRDRIAELGVTHYVRSGGLPDPEGDCETFAEPVFSPRFEVRVCPSDLIDKGSVIDGTLRVWEAFEVTDGFTPKKSR